MKSTGIRRKVDDLGRVVIPAGIRRSLGIREGDQVEVFVEGDQVILAKPVDRCVFCQADEDLQEYRDKVVCRSCVASVGVLDESLRRHRTAPTGAPSHVQAVPDPGTGSQPLPPWTDAGRQRPPLQPAPAPAPESRPDPRPAPAAEAPVRDTAPAPTSPETERREAARYDDPPASTAW